MANKLHGEYMKIQEDLWQARILDPNYPKGWYIGFGKTDEAAKRQAENNYYKEQEKLNQ